MKITAEETIGCLSGTKVGEHEKTGRFSRAAAPPPLVLTPRDEAVVLDCWRYRWLTRQQLQALTGAPGVRRLNGRLRRLYDHGYLDRMRAGTVNAGLQPLYLVGPLGASLIAGRLGLPEGEVRERVRESLRASPMLLPHDLSVNDVMIALLGGIRDDPRAEVLRWSNSRDCHDAYAPGRSLRPDGHLQVLEGSPEEVLAGKGRLLSCFLEVDRGTVGLEKWGEKVRRYGEYRDGGHYGSRYGEGMTRFRVLVLTTSPARLEHLMAATRGIAGRGFWFALTGALLGDAGPRSPLWRRLDAEELSPLL